VGLVADPSYKVTGHHIVAVTYIKSAGSEVKVDKHTHTDCMVVLKANDFKN
jgi:hypothetical protein